MRITGMSKIFEKGYITIIDPKKNYKVSALDDLFRVFKTNFFTRQKWRKVYKKLLSYAIKKNSDDLQLMVEDKQRFTGDYNDGSKWFKGIVRDYDRQIKILEERLENAELHVLFFLIKGLSGGNSKLAIAYRDIGGESLREWHKRGGKTPDFFPEFFSPIEMIDAGIFEEIEFP